MSPADTFAVVRKRLMDKDEIRVCRFCCCCQQSSKKKFFKLKTSKKKDAIYTISRYNCGGSLRKHVNPSFHLIDA